MIPVKHVFLIHPVAGIRQTTRPSAEQGVQLFEREDGAVLYLEAGKDAMLFPTANIKQIVYDAESGVREMVEAMHALPPEAQQSQMQSARGPAPIPPPPTKEGEELVGPGVDGEPDLAAEFPPKAPPPPRNAEAAERERQVAKEARAHAASVARSAEVTIEEFKANELAARGAQAQAAQMQQMQAQLAALQAQLARKPGNADRDEQPEARPATTAQQAKARRRAAQPSAKT